MTDLDSKLMGEKPAGYCSDSDEEGDDGGKEGGRGVDPAPITQSNPPSAPNTGPKGVLHDYKIYKKFQQLEREEQIAQAIETNKKACFTADPNKFPDKKVGSDDDDDFIDDDDDFLREYHEKRLSEMKAQIQKNIQLNSKEMLGKLFEYNGEEMLDAIEKQTRDDVMVVHIYDSLKACDVMNTCLEELVTSYPHVRFCKVLAAKAGLSLKFKMNALPTLQVYKGSKLIGNFLRVHDHLDNEFFPGDVENFLLESDMLLSTDKMNGS